MALVQLDAHSDTWDQYWGSKYSHGTPVRRAIEEGLLAEPHILQVGLRGQLYGPYDMDYAREHKIRVITSEELHEHGLRLVRSKLKAFQSRKTYLSLDIDVVDPAFAPGTGPPQVGGLSNAQILDLVRELKGLNLVGCDLVEVSRPMTAWRSRHCWLRTCSSNSFAFLLCDKYVGRVGPRNVTARPSRPGVQLPENVIR